METDLIRPVLVDARGHIQVLVDRETRGLDPRQAHGFAEGPYWPTDVEEAETGSNRVYRVYVQDGADGSVPPLNRSHLKREIASHHGLLNLFEKFDAVRRHTRIAGEPMVLHLIT